MIRRLAQVAAGLALSLALFASVSAAEAATGWTTTTLNLRAGPGTRYPVVMAMPAGARVEIIGCGGWCEIYYVGRRGYASARYIAFGYAPAPVVRPPMPPAIYWQFGRPWWDDRYRSWHDGRRWWYDDRWHRSPRGGTVYFEFRF